MFSMRTLKTSEAAELLHVSPNTLRAWEQRFVYPKPQLPPGDHRLYPHGEVLALRDALQQGLSIASAVSRAREALSTDTPTLAGVRVMALPVGAASGLSAVAESLSPNAVVIAGGHVPDDNVALWAYRVRAAAGPLPMSLFRRSQHGANVRTTGTCLLPDTPLDAQRRLLALIDERRPSLVREIAAPSLPDGERERREAQA